PPFHRPILSRFAALRMPAQRHRTQRMAVWPRRLKVASGLHHLDEVVDGLREREFDLQVGDVVLAEGTFAYGCAHLMRWVRVLLAHDGRMIARFPGARAADDALHRGHVSV